MDGPAAFPAALGEKLRRFHLSGLDTESTAHQHHGAAYLLLPLQLSDHSRSLRPEAKAGGLAQAAKDGVPTGAARKTSDVRREHQNEHRRWCGTSQCVCVCVLRADVHGGADPSLDPKRVAPSVTQLAIPLFDAGHPKATLTTASRQLPRKSTNGIQSKKVVVASEKTKITRPDGTISTVPAHDTCGIT